MKNYVDYYKILGVKCDASESEIKKAYRKQMSIWHPDHNSRLTEKEKKVALRQTKLINDARDVLLNEDSRTKFNNYYYKTYASDKSMNINDLFVWAGAFRNRNIKKEEIRKQEEEKLKKEEAAKRAQQKEDKKLDDLKRISDRRKSKPVKKHNIIYKSILSLKYRKNDTPRSYVGRNAGIYITGISVLVGVGCISFVLSRKANDKEVEDTLSSISTEVLNSNYDNDEIISMISTDILDRVNELEQEKEESIKETEVVETKEETKTTEETLPENIITLTRMHKIVPGDRLSDFSIDSNTTINEIKKLNNMESDTVVLNKIIQIPYYVEKEDLELYSKVGDVSFSKDICEVAQYYETDLDTLVRLNEEAIVNINGMYQTLSDTLLVPNFISKDEYRNITHKGYSK